MAFWDLREGVRELFEDAQKLGTKRYVMAKDGFLFYRRALRLKPMGGPIEPRVVPWGAAPAGVSRERCPRCDGMLEFREGARWPVHVGRCSFAKVLDGGR